MPEDYKPPVDNPVYQELLKEIRLKLKTFDIPESMTKVGELRSALFTEERAAYYNAHLGKFPRRFRQAYESIIEEGKA